MSGKILWYIADPMCSWCWGFMPVIEAIRHEYGRYLKVRLLLGGLRPGTKIPLPSTQREEILRHWTNVHRITGQPFQFDGAMPKGFVYDTEPACRGIVAASMINPHVIFPFFRAIQSAFYVAQQDVTATGTLMQLASGAGVDAQRFLAIFESDTAKNRTEGQFTQARSWGVESFPAVVVQNSAGFQPLTTGYRPFGELRPQLDEWLANE